MANISIGSLRLAYSGGATNEDQAASLGGAISTATNSKPKSQNTTVPPTITGVVILDAMNNEPGAGTLAWNATSEALTWQPFGAVEGVGLAVTEDGVYTIGSSAGYLVVEVTYASLPGSTLQDSIVVSNAPNETFDNITANQSLAGYTDYRCFYVINDHPTETAADVRLFVKKQPDGADTISLALDPNGLNASASGPLADEEDSGEVLVGLSFSAPATSSSGIQLGDLGPGDYRAFWIRRTVPAETSSQVVNNTSALGISAFL